VCFGFACWCAADTSAYYYVDSRAGELLPEVLSELIEQYSDGPCAGHGGGLFGGTQGQQRLAALVERQYLGRGRREPVKLTVVIRFVRAHSLAQWLDDRSLLGPVLNAYCGGFVQIADSLCEGDELLKKRFVGFAILQGERRAAGRLTERFGIRAAAFVEAPPGWSVDNFRNECAACVREAEEAEERELRAVNSRRIAEDDDDTCCLQLPPELAASVMLVDSDETLLMAADAFRALSAEAACASKANSVENALSDGRALGLDVEWRPTLEKRGGMQKHRRSGQPASMEPCSTLQVAARGFVVIFDLLALAPEASGSASRFSDLCGALFREPRILKLGFGLRQDLQRLAASYPHLECFRQVCGVLDVQEAWIHANGAKGGSATGLSALCARHLGAALSKRLQTSDWGVRPLTEEQIVYASLDAYCLIGLAHILPEASRPICTLEVRTSASGQLLAHASVPDGGGPVEGTDADLLTVESRISAKGAEIRAMKQAGAAKSAVQAEVALLLQLKGRFKELAGVDWVPPVANGA